MNTDFNKNCTHSFVGHIVIYSLLIIIYKIEKQLRMASNLI